MLLGEFAQRYDYLPEDFVFVLRIGRDRELRVRDLLAHVFQKDLHHVDGRVLRMDILRSELDAPHVDPPSDRIQKNAAVFFFYNRIVVSEIGCPGRIGKYDVSFLRIVGVYLLRGKLLEMYSVAGISVPPRGIIQDCGVSLALELLQHLLDRRPAFAVFCHEKKAAADFSRIERKNGDLLVLEFPISVKKVLDGEENPVFLLVGKAYQADVFRDIDECVYGMVVSRILEKAVESVEKPEIRTVDVFPRGFVLVEAQEVGKGFPIAILYRHRPDDIGDENVQAIVPLLRSFPRELDFAEGIFHAGEYDAVIQRKLSDGCSVHSEKIRERILVDDRFDIDILIPSGAVGSVVFRKIRYRQRIVRQHDSIYVARPDALSLGNAVRQAEARKVQFVEQVLVRGQSSAFEDFRIQLSDDDMEQIGKQCGNDSRKGEPPSSGSLGEKIDLHSSRKSVFDQEILEKQGDPFGFVFEKCRKIVFFERVFNRRIV